MSPSPRRTASTVLIGFRARKRCCRISIRKLPYKPLTDFAPRGGVIASAPCVLVVHPSFPAKTVKEFVEHA